MEDIKIVYNRKLVFYIILSTLVISWICLGIISPIFILGAVYFIFFYKNPIKLDWIKKSLIVFDLQKKGIKLYSYEKEIPWDDIDTYYIKFDFFRYYLCIKLRKDIVMAEEKNLFYEKLQQSNILNETHEGDKIIEYPYNFIESSTDDLKSKIEMFLKEYSTYYLEKSQDRLEINKSTFQTLCVGLGSLLFINILANNGTFFLISCFISIPIIFNFFKKIEHTSYLILTKKGFEFPEANFKLDWNVIKLIEVQKGTRDTSGALIIWFNDIQTFINENPKFFSRINDALDYDEEKLKKTGRFKVKCSETAVGEDALREEFQKYIDKYGQVIIQSEDIQKHNKQEERYKIIYAEKNLNNEIENLTNETQNKQSTKLEKEEIKDNTIINIIDEKKEILSENKTTVGALPNLALECNLELQKLVRIQFKSQCTFDQMILLKEEGEYCLAVRVEGLRLDGYCIFLKNQIKTLSYCPDFYNELLQKEYYFKLNTVHYIDLEKWETIFNTYQVKNHFVEIKTVNENYKGKLKEISEEKMVLNAFEIKDKGDFKSVSIDLKSITLSSFETSELMLLEKYSS
ncbi:hypothetical protein [Tepidibacter hydrothermalis]|uniref:Uncharacterized protein n=1 Tax=Tepidibacter hydrothermalis TaxID=3036126 RepID=A0ABY8EG23_9FIRM|nr:hypothetical protein [Tepidibacter hydrothermalis]WFD11903.1 hypothetical protein P4S50_07450 [Tepidibacter hydrothermalis]